MEKIIKKIMKSKKKKDYEEEEEKEDDNEYIYQEDIEKIINSNNIINNEEFHNINLPNSFQNYREQIQYNQQIEKDEKNPKKIIFNEIIEIEYDHIPYQLFIYIKEEKENTLAIELIPKDGHLPHSYMNFLEDKEFYEISSIFMELKTIENIGKKIINLFNKKRASLVKDKKEDFFYLILNITIIDEEKEILIPLNKNDNIQVSTITYLLRQVKEMKMNFINNKSKIKDKIKNEIKKIKTIKNINADYLDIINKIQKEYDEEDEENKNKLIINNNDKNNNKMEINDNSLQKISQIIIEKNEECIKIEDKINKMENELKLLINNFKCEIFPKTILLNIDINNIKPYILIHFELENTGEYPLSSNYDDIFCNIEGISSEIISFFKSEDKYIYLNKNCFPKEKINLCKKLIIKNPSINTKYEFYINIFTLNHGKISKEPAKIIIYVNKIDKEENFISFLNNKKIDFDIKNKKIVFEYFEEGIINKENNNNITEVRVGYKNKRIKIFKYLYDNKNRIAENKNEEKEKIDAFVIINKEEIDKKVKKIYNKYKNLKNIEKYKIEDIICTCAGDFSKICEMIENKEY